MASIRSWPARAVPLIVGGERNNGHYGVNDKRQWGASQSRQWRWRGGGSKGYVGASALQGRIIAVAPSCWMKYTCKSRMILHLIWIWTYRCTQGQLFPVTIDEPHARKKKGLKWGINSGIKLNVYIHSYIHTHTLYATDAPRWSALKFCEGARQLSGKKLQVYPINSI